MDHEHEDVTYILNEVLGKVPGAVQLEGEDEPGAGIGLWDRYAVFTVTQKPTDDEDADEDDAETIVTWELRFVDYATVTAGESDDARTAAAAIATFLEGVLADHGSAFAVDRVELPEDEASWWQSEHLAGQYPEFTAWLAENDEPGGVNAEDVYREACEAHVAKYMPHVTVCYGSYEVSVHDNQMRDVWWPPAGYHLAPGFAEEEEDDLAGSLIWVARDALGELEPMRNSEGGWDLVRVPRNAA